jgi:hypothetical protein
MEPVGESGSVFALLSIHGLTHQERIDPNHLAFYL